MIHLNNSNYYSFHLSEVIASLEVIEVTASLEVIDDSFSAESSLVSIVVNFERSQTAIARPLVACKARTSLTSLTSETIFHYPFSIIN